MRTLSLVVLLTAVSGCNAGPDCHAFLFGRNKQADQARFEYFDPYPDDSVGPRTFTRGRDNFTQRTEPRQVKQNRAALGAFAPPDPNVPPGPGAGPEFPSSRNRYPGVVRE